MGLDGASALAFQPVPASVIGVGLVGFFGGEQLGADFTKHLLRFRENSLVLRTAARDIEQPKEHARGADPERVVEIAGGALACEGRGDLRFAQYWKCRRNRLDRESWFLFAKCKE